jgi:ATP-dependent RNA helicase RhlE
VQALKPQLDGRDLLGMAETGSGKTATFVLPILQKIAAEAIEPAPKQVSALILAPTRELAIQIDQEVASLGRNMRIRRAVVLGGVSKGPQINALKRGVHVLVATPGRLLDHVNMRTCDLSRVQMFVLDEADRMFDMGFIRDIRKIVSLIPAERRTALFSATMPTEIKKFAYEILKDPYRVDLSPKSVVVDRIDQKVMIVRTPEKQSRLHTILGDEACKRVIVFTRTKRGADRVADRLGMANISAAAFHGNKAQNARQRALNDFTMGHIRVLVATDIAARGIDVSNITHVVNFDMPLDPETYVHRVGRTARKGNSGIAISLCDPSERQEITAIERLMKQKLEVIADVGGEALPMPERRPHRQNVNGSNDRGRDSRRRDELGRPHQGRPNGRQCDRGGLHQPLVDAPPEREALFGVGAPSERQPERRQRPDRNGSHTGQRGNHAAKPHRDGARPRHPRPEGEHHTRGHRGSDRRPDERGSGGHRPHEVGARDDIRVSGERPQRRQDHQQGDRRQTGGHQTGNRNASSERRGERPPEKRQHARTEGKRPWDNANTPKFMKRDGDGRRRQDRSPAS